VLACMARGALRGHDLPVRTDDVTLVPAAAGQGKQPRNLCGTTAALPTTPMEWAAMALVCATRTMHAYASATETCLASGLVATVHLSQLCVAACGAPSRIVVMKVIAIAVHVPSAPMRVRSAV
jgi:hypothetical protein